MRKKRPRDPLQLAKLIDDIATGQVEDRVGDNRNPAAVELGRRGGLKGGKARPAKLSKKRRSAIAKKGCPGTMGTLAVFSMTGGSCVEAQTECVARCPIAQTRA